MATALVLDLDEQANTEVRRIWAALDAVGIPSLGTKSEAEAPHVSVTMFEGGEPDAFMNDVERILPSLSPLHLTLDALCLFPTPGVLFLGTVITQQMIDLQRCISESATKWGGTIREYYRAERWIPHCTLAMALSGDDLARAVRALCGITLPIRTTAASASLVDSTADVVLRTVALS